MLPRQSPRLSSLWRPLHHRRKIDTESEGSTEETDSSENWQLLGNELQVHVKFLVMMHKDTCEEEESTECVFSSPPQQVASTLITTIYTFPYTPYENHSLISLYTAWWIWCGSSCRVRWPSSGKPVKLAGTCHSIGQMRAFTLKLFQSIIIILRQEGERWFWQMKNWLFLAIGLFYALKSRA